MSERTKNQLKQASSILLITDFQAFTDFTQYISFFFFLLWGTNPYRAERMDGLYIGAVHYCKTHVNPPSRILSMLYPPAFFASAWLAFGSVSQIDPKDFLCTPYLLVIISKRPLSADVSALNLSILNRIPRYIHGCCAMYYSHRKCYGLTK